MKRGFLFCFLVLTFLVPINVFAQTPFYIVIKPGIYSPQSSDLDVTGFNGEIAFGYRFNPYIAAEFGIGYFYTEGEKTVVGATYVDRENFDIDVYPVTLTLKAILPYKKWEFFGLGGVGLILFLADMMMRIMTMIIMIMTMIIITIRYWGAIWEQESITI
jgi:hypothetical protein